MTSTGTSLRPAPARLHHWLHTIQFKQINCSIKLTGFKPRRRDETRVWKTNSLNWWKFDFAMRLTWRGWVQEITAGELRRSRLLKQAVHHITLALLQKMARVRTGVTHFRPRDGSAVAWCDGVRKCIAFSFPWWFVRRRLRTQRLQQAMRRWDGWRKSVWARCFCK